MGKAGHSVDVRDRILDAALALFARHGYHGTTTRRICERAGVPLGSLHYHFESKEALYAAVLESMLREEAEIGRAMEKEFAGNGADGGRGARLERLVRLWVEFLFEHPAVARIGLHRIVEDGVEDFPADTPSPLPAGRGVEGLLERALGISPTPEARAQVLAANDIVAGFVGGAAHHARILGIPAESRTYRDLVTRTVLALYEPLVEESMDGP
jgi:AcrR family transcriptional regulator